MIETWRPDPIYYQDNEKVALVEDNNYRIVCEDLDMSTLSQKWIIIDAPTGAGKTHLIHENLPRFEKVLVVVPRISLTTTLYIYT